MAAAKYTATYVKAGKRVPLKPGGKKVFGAAAKAWILRVAKAQPTRWPSLKVTVVAGAHYPNATHYSLHFSRKELDCKCGCTTPADIQRKLAKVALNLERLRVILGGHLGIVSGYRCVKHNREVHGAIDSQHTKGTAADLAVPNGQQDHYVAAAKKVYAFLRGGIGVYPSGSVHVDIRGYVARWSSFIGQ